MQLKNSILIEYVGKNVELEGIIEEVTVCDEDISKYTLNIEKIIYDMDRDIVKEKVILKVIGEKKI